MKQLAAMGAVDMNHLNPKQIRSGATLVEILMAMMVMSIGLVSVASLFPISMLRSMQATQLTNAALLQSQVEDYIRAFPEVLRNDYDVSYDVNSHLPTDTFPSVNPPRVRPNVVMRPTSNLFAAGEYGSPELTRWGQRDPSAYFSQPAYLNFVQVIDPIGASFYSGDPDLTKAKYFGKNPYGIVSVDPFRYLAVRTNGGLNLDPNAQLPLAYQMFSSGDSWSHLHTSVDVVGTGGSNIITLNDISSADLESFRTSLNNNVLGRVVVYSQSGKQSFVSPVAFNSGTNSFEVNAATGAITLTNPLPNNGHYAAIPEVRLETFEARYTCLITVRKKLLSFGQNGMPGDAAGPDYTLAGWPGSDDVTSINGANLVVFYRRDFSELAEQVYPSEFFPETQTVRIRWGSEDSKPKLTTGTWAFDPVNGYWHKLASVLSAAGSEAVVQLQDGAPGTSVYHRRKLDYLIIPDRVVEVFDFAL